MTDGAGADRGTAFVKGHGTGNDFVLLPDPLGVLDLGPALVAALCDRRSGVGGDGVLRVVPTELADDPAVRQQAAGARWFMDYRNADGSLAEMCGNGVRVFARYLVEQGLEAQGTFTVATRAGSRRVDVALDGSVTVDMGPAGFGGPVGVEVRIGGGAGAGGGPATWLPAVAVDMGNPHAVVLLDAATDLDALGPLYEAPPLRPAGAFPHGVNIELAVVRSPGHAVMRVHERGVGETQSCGTGACAVFAVARAAAGPGAPAAWAVDVPGGRLTLLQRDDGGIDLTGPAVLVASGTLDPRWLQEATR